MGEQSLHKFLKTQVVYLELDMRMHETETHMPVASIASCTLPTPSAVAPAGYTSWATKVQSNGVNAHKLDAMVVQRIAPCICTSGV
jgi:hypothetical protein